MVKYLAVSVDIDVHLKCWVMVFSKGTFTWIFRKSSVSLTHFFSFCILLQLIVPGSCIVFEPDIYVTVIAHTPFFTTPAQQVLVQGWQLTSDNLDEFLSAIQKQLQLLEDTIAEVSGIAHDYLETDRMMQVKINILSHLAQ